MRTTLTLIFLILSLNLKSQITFEKTYQFTSGIAIEEMPDGSFIGCGDSVQTGLIFEMDRFGNLTSMFKPTLRDTNISVLDISSDPLTGGYAICGRAEDTTGNGFTGYYLLIDSLMQNTDSIFFAGGVGSGPSATNILRTSTNEFIVGISTWHGAGNSSYDAQKISYPATQTWVASGGSNHSTNGIALDNDGNLLFASFNWVSASAAYFSKFDTAGNYLNGFGISDTAYGGSLVFESVTAPAPDGNNMFGVHLAPNGGSNSVEYLSKLDSTFNKIWDKYLDWGYNINLIAITPTYDSCIVLLLSTDSGLAIHKLNLSGDSLWTQFHNRPTSGFGNRFQQCADHGFVIIGQYMDSVSTRGYILKTDSLGRLLPDVSIQMSGALTFCQGDSVELTAMSGYSYLWSTGETSQSITVYSSAGYSVTVSDTNGLQATSDLVNILVHPVPAQPSIIDSSGILYSSQANSYQWFIDGFPISNSDTIAMVPFQTGFYLVHITDSNGCSAVSNSFYYDLTGLAELYSNNSSCIFPNPSNGKFEFKLAKGNSNELLIEIFDLMGSRIYKKEISDAEPNLIEIKNVPGVYVLLVTGLDKKAYKIIVE